jgi:hypothetical protein
MYKVFFFYIIAQIDFTGQLIYKLRILIQTLQAQI